jgi:phosphoglycolate phosphatase
MDGTLLDTIGNIANSVNFALKEHNFLPHTIEEYRLCSGNGIDKLIEKVLPVEFRNADWISMLKVDFIKYYYAHFDQYTLPYPGVSELINKLYAEGYKLAVASNKVHDSAVKQVLQFFPDIKFTTVSGKRDGYPLKPNGGVLEEIIKIAGAEKSETLYIGDSGIDVATAYNAKVPFVGVLWSLHTRRDLEEAGASCFAETTAELDGIIHS